MATMEPSDALYYITATVALAVLIGLYFFGVWSGSYVMPTPHELSLRKQLVAAIPVGLVTMGAYAKSAFPALTQSHANIPFDAAVMGGYAIFLGMLSRETLERLLQGTTTPVGTPPGT